MRLSKKINNMINHAFNAGQNSAHKHKVGCVVFDKNIIAKSWNSNKTHPNLPGLIDKLHAEMRVLKYLGNDATGAYMVVVRGTKKKPLLAKPCYTCLERIKESGVKKVIYSTENGFEIIKL